MMVALCRKLVNSALETVDLSLLLNIKTVTGYGLAFGSEYECTVYKLVLHFDTNTCNYIEQFNQPYCMRSPASINAAISYILKHVCTWPVNQ